MKILVTGVAGFIGFSFAHHILKKKNVIVFGLDNIDNYYSIKLKYKRLKILKKNKKFFFKKIDITNKKKLNYALNKKKISVIINLAAQAGVRYSLIKPTEFVENNILGFYNIVNFAKIHNIKKILYASSSSVYGDTDRFPLNEKQNIKPKNIYALSKKINEEMANVFSNQFKISLIGLRFFTVYGEWGRPDMFMMKYLSSSYNQSKKFYLNNYGNHTRDFTYIEDACKIVSKLIFSKKNINNQIFNICSNKPINLLKIINKINKLTNKKPRLYKRNLQKADVIKTHGSNKKIIQKIGKIQFTTIEVGLNKTVMWFKKYYKV